MPLNFLNPYKSYATKDLTKKNILLMIYQLVTLIRFSLNLTESKYSHPLDLNKSLGIYLTESKYSHPLIGSRIPSEDIKID